MELNAVRPLVPWTVSPGLRDDLQRLAVELGIPTAYGEQIPANQNHQKRFQLSFGRPQRRQVALRKERNISRERYSGLVWCLTVPTGAYFVRRNGQVSVSGNSAHWVNKPDIGLVIERDDQGTASQCIVHGRKFRFSFLGKKGATSFVFDPKTELLSQ